MAQGIEYVFPAYAHDGNLIQYHQKAWDAWLINHDNTDVEIIIRTVRPKKTKEQVAYYMGGIIRGTLMKTEEFAGKTFDEIDHEIREAVRTEKAVQIDKHGVEHIIEFINAEISKFDIDEMAKFINDVLDWLATELNIHPLPPEFYKQGKYLIDKRDQL